MSKYRFGSIVNRNFRNTLQRLADDATAQGKAIQDLVAEGQLTPEQYSELLETINGMVKSGQIDKSDLNPEFKDEIEGFSAQLAHKANDNEVRKKSDKLEPEDASERFIALITGQGTVNLESIPQDDSVTISKLSPELKGIADLLATLTDENESWVV